MSTDKDLPTLILTEIYLLSHEEGGRQHPIAERYWCHVVTPPSDEYLSIYVLSIESHKNEKLLFLGTTSRVTWVLMYSDVDYSALVPGANFEIREGARCVGRGKVLELV